VTPEQRLAAFRKMADERPRDPFARYSLAMALRAAGRDAEAVREFEELRRGSPEYLPTYLMLGQALEGLGRREEAARAYAEGVEAAARARDGHAGGELAQALEALRAQAS
jgi:predicted Zn-dependent protease